MSSAHAPIEVLIFDHYGTLFDKLSVATLFEQALPAHGTAGLELAELWFAKSKEYCWLYGLMNEFRDWAEISERALDYAGKKLGILVPDDLQDKLLAADRQLPPFPDVEEGLVRLANKYKLAVLSMASDEIVHASLAHSGLEKYFSKIISTEPVQAYKPGIRAYRHGLRALNCTREQAAFVSANSYDVVGAKVFGLQSYWVNRHEKVLEELGFEPDLSVADLAALADALEA